MSELQDYIQEIYVGVSTSFPHHSRAHFGLYPRMFDHITSFLLYAKTTDLMPSDIVSYATDVVINLIELPETQNQLDTYNPLNVYMRNRIWSSLTHAVIKNCVGYIVFVLCIIFVDYGLVNYPIIFLYGCTEGSGKSYREYPLLKLKYHVIA